MSQAGRKSVLVVGAGGAGLAAALEAARAGAEVTVLDAAERVGGATARAGGVVYAADTPVQKAAGVEDSVEDLFAYLMTISHYRLEPRLVRTSAERTREAVDWLTDLGVEWPPERLYPGGLETMNHRRGHMPSGDTGGLGPAGGAVIVNALLTAAQAAGVTIRTGVRVVELIRESPAGAIGASARSGSAVRSGSPVTSATAGETGGAATSGPTGTSNSIATSASALGTASRTRVGAVTGVVTTEGERITADAIVLATGGFGASRELLAEHYPDATAHGDWHWYIGPSENVGDGLTMGLDAGGTVVNENAGVLMETPNFSRVVDGFTPPWLVFVNSRGHRFVNEMASYCVLGSVIGAQPEGRCFALFDAAALAVATEDPAFTDPYGLGVVMESNWTSEVLNAQIAAGKVYRADTLEELATAAGIAPDGLEATVEAWNADVDGGHDRTFEKTPTMLLPVSTPPYHAVELRPAVIGMTFAGLRIDDRAHVLDAAGRPIPGLFAAGELTGGLMGWIYPAGGTSIGNALVFGRIAGTEAAGTEAAGTEAAGTEAAGAEAAGTDAAGAGSKRGTDAAGAGSKRGTGPNGVRTRVRIT